MELGKRLVEKALHTYGLQLNQVSETHLDIIINHSHLESISHLFEEVGIGNRPALLVAKQIAKAFGETFKKDETDTHVHHPLIIKGTEGLVIVYGKC